MSYGIEVTNKDGEQEQLVAVDKGYIDGKEIVLAEDGRTFENTPTAGLVEFEGQEPFALAAEEEEEVEVENDDSDTEASDDNNVVIEDTGEDAAEEKEGGYMMGAHADHQGDPPSHKGQSEQ